MTLLSGFNQHFTPYLIDFFQKKKNATSAYSPIIREAIEKIASLTLSGGKRIRPALIYFAYQGFGGKSFKKVKNYCLSIELIQSWALIHDDIMDKAQTRRGKETIHTYFDKKYNDKKGESLAILCGDLAFSWAVELFDPKKELTRLFSALTQEVIYGQMLDIGKVRSQKQALQMMQWKTAGYSIEKPLVIGAILAGASPPQISIVSKIGIKLGLAFQMKDDVEGIFSTTSRIGKPITSDMREGKMHLLALKTLQKLNTTDKKMFYRIWGDQNSGEKELEFIKSLMIEKGSFDEYQKIFEMLLKECQVLIKTDLIPELLRNTLRSLIDDIFMVK